MGETNITINFDAAKLDALGCPPQAAVIRAAAHGGNAPAALRVGSPGSGAGVCGQQGDTCRKAQATGTGSKGSK